MHLESRCIYKYVILCRYSRRTGRVVIETGFWVADSEPWLGASPDGLVANGCVEIKCSKQPWSGSLERFQPQTQGTMWVLRACGLGCEFCDIFLWSPGKSVCHRLEFDEAYADALVARASAVCRIASTDSNIFPEDDELLKAFDDFR